jgi:hypothetical protein
MCPTGGRECYTLDGAGNISQKPIDAEMAKPGFLAVKPEMIRRK